MLFFVFGAVDLNLGNDGDKCVFNYILTLVILKIDFFLVCYSRTVSVWVFGDSERNLTKWQTLKKLSSFVEKLHDFRTITELKVHCTEKYMKAME